MEDTVEKGNRWETDWEKIITTFKTDKGLISKIIKQFLQINKKKRGTGKEYEYAIHRRGNPNYLHAHDEIPITSNQSDRN